MDEENWAVSRLSEILAGKITVANLEADISVTENDYLMEAIFIHLRFIAGGKKCYIDGYGMGVDIHKSNIGFGRKALCLRWKEYGHYHHQYNTYKSITVDYLQTFIKQHVAKLKKAYNHEPDLEMIAANKDSLLKRAVGESLGLGYIERIDDFE